MEILIWLLVAIAIIVAVYFIANLTSGQAEYRGWKGEKKVFSILKRLSDDYYVWNDIVLQQNGYSVQIDHVVISQYGIFVIETKNYTGIIYGNETSDKWTKNMFGYHYHFANPIKQNRSHVKALANLFCISIDSFIPIVVFLHGAELQCNTQSTVIYAGQLLEVINDYCHPVMTSSDVQRLVTILNTATVENENTRLDHLNKVNERIKRKNYMIYNGICPNCGGRLVEREGRYGNFIGCSNYPRCKFTTQL